jgi:hypothetical protein
MSMGHGGGEVAAGSSSGGRGARGKGQRGRGTGPGKGESDAWSPPEQEVAPGRSWSGGGHRCQPVAEGEAEQSRGARGRREGGGGVRGVFLKFLKISGILQ